MSKRMYSIIRLGLLAATLLGAFWLGFEAIENETVQNLIATGGYVGVFLFSFINGFNVVVPIITASFIPALTASGLNLYILILIMTIGMTAADSIAYFLARAGRVHLNGRGNHVLHSIEKAEHKRHWLPLAILGLWAFIIPLPNEVILIPLGLLGYHVHRVLPVALLGNLAFNTAVGFGLINLFPLFGI